jgi:hypothetical protein
MPSEDVLAYFSESQHKREGAADNRLNRQENTVHQLDYVRCEVHRAVMTSVLFWVATPCGLVGRYRRFGEIYFTKSKVCGNV